MQLNLQFCSSHLLPVILLASSQLAFAQSQVEAWPDEAVKAAIAGCRTSIIDHSRSDYLARHKLTEQQLPANFNERILPVLEPFLATCTCTINIVSREVPLAEFSIERKDIKQRFEQLIGNGGICDPLLKRK